MSNTKTVVKVAVPVVALAMMGSFYVLKTSSGNRSMGDDALLALMKNDKDAFVSYIEAGGDVHFKLPTIESHTFTVAEGMAYFERKAFMEYLQSQKKPFVVQEGNKEYDILSITVYKNNPDMLKLLTKENPKMDLKYGKNGWTLLHMASAECSDKMVNILRESSKLSWDTTATDGTTPLTIAAQHDCLSILSYWKENGADFNAKDAQGKSALSILKTKKNAALVAFAKSFEPDRTIAALAMLKKEVIPDFYKKRKNPKDMPVNHADLIEPEDRPEDAIETADYSEFSD